MIQIYFLRHGQAGSRDDYDRLSDLGREQAALLGEYLARERVRFDVAISGGLRRQRETAQLALAGLNGAGLTPAQIIEDPRWNEFDLDMVYAGIAPRIAAENAEFRMHYEEMQRRIRSGDDMVHRVWTPADGQVVEAWIRGSYEIEAESWLSFTDRVRQAGRDLAKLPDGSKVAVFTSATPISLWIAAAFGSSEPLYVMRLAGAAINTNISRMALENGEPLLMTFNGTPHLTEKRLRTSR